MIKYIIYTQDRCGHCESAKMILREAGETFEERKLDTTEKIKDLEKQDIRLYHKSFYI